MKRVMICLMFCSVLGFPVAGLALDIYLSPDSVFDDVGQVVSLTGSITESALMRSFTVYMAYDTNVIDLAAPPTPGALIASRVGLQFNYFDHAPILPNLLEVTATVFGTDFWAGPGDLFHLQFNLRSCADAPITAPYPPFMVAADNTYPQANFVNAQIFVCDRVPTVPTDLTIYPDVPGFVRLNWNPVTSDTLSRPLIFVPSYQVFRQAIVPTIGPLVNIATVPDTFFVDAQDATISYNYLIQAQVTP